MFKSKLKLDIITLIIALSFLFLAVCPLIMQPVYNILLGEPFLLVFKNWFSYIFRFTTLVPLIGYIVIIAGVFTKYFKPAVAVGSALFWLSTLVGLISNIVNYIKLEYLRFSFIGLPSHLANMLAYAIMFVLAIWLTYLSFAKKEAPKFIKILVFIPAVIFALLLVFSLFGNIFSIFSYLTTGHAFKFLLYFITERIVNIISSIVLTVGFGAVAVKLANIKRKPKNTIEISDDVVIENVISE